MSQLHFLPLTVGSFLSREAMCSHLFSLILLPIVSSFVKTYNLEEVSIDPPPKPQFLMNATHESIEQFMAIYRTPGITQMRKVTELDVLVGTLRPEVQQAYQDYKADALLQKLSQDERLQEVTEKAHYTMVHLAAMKNSRSIGQNERKARTELVFAEFSEFLVNAVTDEVGNALHATMRQILRAILFTEKMTQK